MKSILHLFLLLAAVGMGSASAQDLRKIAPITVRAGDLPDSLSFVLTTLDDNLYKGKTLTYESAIEIIDADASWPPRWYALHTPDSVKDIRPSLMLNASYENGYFLFFTVATTPSNRNELAVLTCDDHMVPIDTFFPYRKTMDSHDFVSSPTGEMMYFAVHDTLVDMSQLYHNPLEMAVHMTYQTIEVADHSGLSVFSWNPFTALGFESIHLPYRYTRGVRASHTKFDWSHGNSVHYDYDGNILYSLKHIGIGKVSRTDGHVIWHIDRIHQRVNPLSDSLPIYLQHDLQAVKDSQGHISYTVWSNGDSLHPYCRGYQFTVSLSLGGETVVRLLRTIYPHDSITHTGGGGNMDVDQYGSYLLNYGLFTQDTTLPRRSLFEYKDERRHRAAQYETAPTIFTFRAHVMKDRRPARPVISLKGGNLNSDIHHTALRWYRLSGTRLTTVEYLGKGETYQPKVSGFYCVASPYGIGWAVSRPFRYTSR